MNIKEAFDLGLRWDLYSNKTWNNAQRPPKFDFKTTIQMHKKHQKDILEIIRSWEL